MITCKLVVDSVNHHALYPGVELVIQDTRFTQELTSYSSMVLASGHSIGCCISGGRLEVRVRIVELDIEPRVTK